MIPSSKKILSRQQAVVWREKQKKAKRKVVFTNGCFDILHKGHVALMELARLKGDCLIVGLNSDASVKRLKGETRPINNQDDRAAVLASLEAVDCVVIFGEDTPFELLSEIRPDILAKGADYKVNEIVGREFAGKVVRVNLVKGKSTTGLIKKIGLQL